MEKKISKTKEKIQFTAVGLSNDNKYGVKESKKKHITLNQHD